jgi:hypothetical protein
MTNKNNKMNKRYIYALTLLIAALASCNDREIYEQEQYKKVLAMVSSDDYNIFSRVHDLGEPETIGYVSVSCGGTLPTSKPLNITIAPDPESFDSYNRSNFDVDSARFAHLLPASMYDIDSYQISIQAGERLGKTAIRVRPEGLSPDSTYFIPLKMEQWTDIEVNPNKSNVLYRVLIKNRYATQESNTVYTMRAYRGATQLPGSKLMQPLSRNRVRTMPGNVAFQSNLETINKWAIVLEIGADNSVKITPWKNVSVTQIDGDPDYPNIFRIEDTGYRKYLIFRLRYDYKDGATTYQMKEELSLETKE